MASDLTDVEAWAHYFAPEPLKSKLQSVIADAKLMAEVRKAIEYPDGLARDGWEMIEAAMRDTDGD